MKEESYGLALGGGAARGLVHIGVLKYLEEKNIKIGEIAGTSMGALVGAFYASGKNAKEIKKIAEELEYFKVLDFDLRYGFIKGEKIIKKLKHYFGDLKIEDLHIKLKIMATNIETGELKVFEKGSLVDALRASISIPGIFKPHKIGKEFFIDGLVVKNLPIDELSLEKKIGVSASKVNTGPLKSKVKFLGFDFNRGFFSLNYQILHRSITNMMLQNELKSIENTKGEKQVLEFDFGDLDFFNFSEVENFIKLGYKIAKKDLKL